MSPYTTPSAPSDRAASALPEGGGAPRPGSGRRAAGAPASGTWAWAFACGGVGLDITDGKGERLGRSRGGPQWRRLGEPRRRGPAAAAGASVACTSACALAGCTTPCGDDCGDCPRAGGTGPRIPGACEGARAEGTRLATLPP